MSSSTPPGRALHKLLALWLMAMPGLCAPRSVLAQPAIPPAQQLRDAGLEALGQKKSKLAQTRLEQAYLRDPSPELLKLLAEVAELQGNPVIAADLFRRYVEEAPAGAATPELVARINAAQDQAAEVAVSGPAGAFLRVDGRLIGRLELSRSLLLTPGEHLLTLEQAAGSREHQVSATRGVPTSVRFSENAAGSVLETRPPTVLLVYNNQLEAGLQLAGLKRSLLSGLRHDGQAHDMAPELAAAGLRGQPAGCAADLACLLKLGAQLGCRFLLRVHAAPGTETAVQLELFDVLVQGLGARAAWSCPGCPAEKQAVQLRDVAESLMSEALARPSGELRIATSPPGANISIDEEPRPALTPSTLRLFGGAHQVTVRKPGYLSQHAQVMVNPEAPAALELVLPINRAAQRRQRLAIGQWTMLAAGLVGVLGGSLALALNGQRRTVDEGSGPTDEKLLSWPYGVAAVGTGTLALGASVILWGVKLRALRAEAAAER